MDRTIMQKRVGHITSQFYAAYNRAAARAGNRPLSEPGKLSAVQEAYEAGLKTKLQDDDRQQGEIYQAKVSEINSLSPPG